MASGTFVAAAASPGSGAAVAAPHSDPFFGKGIIDRDEWADTPRRHRRVHGYLEDTETRFTIYLPPADEYRERLFQVLEGGTGGHESIAISPLFGLDAAFDLGGALVECNQGHTGDLKGIKGDPTILAWRANVASARFAQSVMADMYGKPPKRTYVYGGSGGGHRSVRALEYGEGFYDGAVPFMIPPPRYVAHSSTLNGASYFLRDKIDGIIDALDPGGSGDPFAGLTTVEADILAAAFRTGHPRRSAFLLRPDSLVGLLMPLGVANLREEDPGYFVDFWTKPGYVGHDNPGLFAGRDIHAAAVVERLVTVADIEASTDPRLRMLVGRSSMPHETVIGIVLSKSGLTDLQLLAADMIFTSGERKGDQLVLGLANNGMIIPATTFTGRVEDLLKGVKVGDKVDITNRGILALSFYALHAPVDPSTAWFDQPTLDGTPKYAQRTIVSDGGFIARPPHKGTFRGKMILLQHMNEGTICNPAAAAYYDSLVRDRMGKDIDDTYRLWFIERAHHVPAAMVGPSGGIGAANRILEYQGIVDEALHYLVDWVENDISPPSSSNYSLNKDYALELPDSAAKRGGIQAVVVARANGAPRADVRVGESVDFDVAAQLPAGTGNIVKVEWDFDGSGKFGDDEHAAVGRPVLKHATSHAYDKAGTYFAAVRVHSTNITTRQVRRTVTNLDRVRIVVS